MSSLACVRLRKAYTNYATCNDVLDLLIVRKIIQVIDGKNEIVIGRYSTNKGKLKKVLND